MSDRHSPLVLKAGRAEASFWLVAIAFVVTTSFTTVPTPLWTLYQQHDGFATVWLTIAFSSYVLGVIVALLFLGHVSDWRGRKPLLIAALALELVAALLLILSRALPLLITARVISGLGIGILTATATAYLGELNRAAGGAPVRAVVVATAANLGGLGMGPIVGGLFAQSAGAPLRTPWVLYAVVLAVALVLALIPAETVQKDSTRRYHPQHLVIEAEHRATYLAAAAGGFGFFAVTGLSGSLEPMLLAQLGVRSHLVAGGASAVVFLAAAVSQIALVRLPIGRQLTVGLVLLGVGAVGMALGVGIPGATVVFVLGSLLGGAGGGILLKGALGTAAELAPAGHVGESTAGIFVATFLGMGLPVVIVGILTDVGVPLLTSLIGFSCMVLAIAIGAGITFSRHPAPEPPTEQ